MFEGMSVPHYAERRGLEISPIQTGEGGIAVCQSNSSTKADLQDTLDQVQSILQDAYQPESTREDLAAAVGDALDAIGGENADEDEDLDDDDDSDQPYRPLCRRFRFCAQYPQRGFGGENQSPSSRSSRMPRAIRRHAEVLLRRSGVNSRNPWIEGGRIHTPFHPAIYDEILFVSNSNRAPRWRAPDHFSFVSI